jgi:hypothetical protein
MNKISVVSMSRRFEGYCKLVEQFENIIPNFIEQYIVFVNDDKLKSLYKSLENQNKKVKCVFANENFVFKNGHSVVYNYLDSLVQSEWILKLFDTDRIELDIELFKKEFEKSQEKNVNIFGIPTFMQRGEVWENKYQLYKKGIANWHDAVHENLIPNVQLISYDLKSFKVYHENSLDNNSKNLKKDNEGFLILEKTEEGTDSDNRNLLYEFFSWKIVHGELNHQHKQWFDTHYSKNKNLIDWYYERAKKKYNL